MYAVIWKYENGNRDWIKADCIYDADNVSLQHENAEIFISMKEFRQVLYERDILKDELKEIQSILDKERN